MGSLKWLIRGVMMMLLSEMPGDEFGKNWSRVCIANIGRSSGAEARARAAAAAAATAIASHQSRNARNHLADKPAAATAKADQRRH